MSMAVLRIRWKRLVSDGQTCKRCGSTGAELENAINSLKQALAPLDIQVVLEKEEMSLAEFKASPLASNQIWLNDRPLEDWIGGHVGQSNCCDLCGPSDCRTVTLGEQVFEAIPAGVIIKAGLVAASQLVGVKEGELC